MSETHPEPESTRTFDGPHGQSHVSVYPAHGADTVLLLHSGGMSGHQWRRAVSRLRGEFRLLVPDMLGMGSSAPWPAERPFHFEQDVAQLSALLQDEPKVHVVGHSYGGFLALQLALREPSRFASMALFEPPAFGVLSAVGDPLFDDVLVVQEHGDAAPGTPAFREHWLRGFIDFWNQRGAWEQLSAEAKQRYLSVSPKLEAEVVTLLADRTPSEAYRALTLPVLMMGGELSPRSERAVVERVAAALPNAILEWFAGAGHLAPITHALKVAERVRAHLARVGARAA